MKKRLLQKTNSGFTLIEVLIAIAILMVAITGTLVLGSTSATKAKEASTRVTANRLAQDAMEYIIELKNYDLAERSDWLHSLHACENTLCGVDTTTPLNHPHIITNCGTNSCALLNEDNVFQYSSGEKSLFTRTFTLETLATNPNERRVVVIVSYQAGLQKRSFTLRTNIFNN